MTKKIKEYKIVREDYWDDGEVKTTFYRVMKRNRLFGTWVYVKKEVASWSDSHYSPVSFNSITEADKFVEKLMQGAKVQGWTCTDEKTYTSS
jgi:hypothetical protein